MIKFSKILFTNPAKIQISGIICNSDSILKITDIFKCNWVLLTIDSISQGSPLLRFAQNQGLQYHMKQKAADSIELSVIIPYNLLENVLEGVISEGPENIFIINLSTPSNHSGLLKCPYEELVAIGIANMFMSISMDESAITVFVNKYLLPCRDVYKTIKTLPLKGQQGWFV